MAIQFSPQNAESLFGKDQGKLIPVPKIKNSQLVVEGETEARSSFIPPCTKAVFLKYYSPTSESPNYWDKIDSEAYRQNMCEILKEFGVSMDIENNSNEVENE
jgi:hypothetical protein